MSKIARKNNIAQKPDIDLSLWNTGCKVPIAIIVNLFIQTGFVFYSVTLTKTVAA